MPILDRFASQGPGPDGPAVRCFAITPDDEADLSELVRGLFVGGGGAVAIVDMEGGTTVFAGVPSGTVLPVRVRRVRATDTTATALVGLV
jgi:hypothetical protein